MRTRTIPPAWGRRNLCDSDAAVGVLGHHHPSRHPRIRPLGLRGGQTQPRLKGKEPLPQPKGLGNKAYRRLQARGGNLNTRQIPITCEYNRQVPPDGCMGPPELQLYTLARAPTTPAARFRLTLQAADVAHMARVGGSKRKILFENLEPKWHWMHFGSPWGTLGNACIPPRACPYTRMYHVAPKGHMGRAQSLTTFSYI